MRMIVALAGLAAIALPAAQAAAQVVGTYRVRVGLGAQLQPEWLGSDETEIAPYPKLSIAKGDEPFGIGAPDDSLSYSLVSDDFSAGPVAALRSGRKDSDVGAPVGDVGRTVEVGAFAQYEIGESFRVRGELRQGIGGHEGMVGHVGADYVSRWGDAHFSIGPRLRFSNGKFQRAFFGVGADEAAAAGLSEYRPGGGVYAVGAISGFHVPISGPWGLFGYARYDRLVGDAADSPIVRGFGSRNQYSAGIGISHTFTLKL